jgi:hypothetical protein
MHSHDQPTQVKDTTKRGRIEFLRRIDLEVLTTMGSVQPQKQENMFCAGHVHLPEGGFATKLGDEDEREVGEVLNVDLPIPLKLSIAVRGMDKRGDGRIRTRAWASRHIC